MINEELSKKFGYNYNTLSNYIKNWQPVEELEWLNKFQDRRFIIEVKEDEREFFDRGWRELREAKPDLKISYRDFVDNKIEVDGQKRKLFKYINDKNLSELVGKYKLPKTKLYLVISTNFDDFLMCSTKNSWTACTNLENGDFRFTTMGNIFTKGRFIVYITDLEKKEYCGLESYKMFYRCFGFINEDGEMVGNIWYPIKTYMAFPNEYFKSVREVENKKAKYEIEEVFNDYDFFVYPYLDYSYLSDDGKYVFSDEYLRYHPAIKFKNNQEVSYSDKILYIGDTNMDSMISQYCDFCGTKKGFIQTVGSYNYCEDCYEKAMIKHCAFCGNPIPLKDASFTEDNKWIHKSCIENAYGRKDVKTCACGTLIKKKGEDSCRYCRSDRIDAFKNISFSYVYDKNNFNIHKYFRHCYVDDGDILPGLKYDEELFEEYEVYIKNNKTKCEEVF